MAGTGRQQRQNKKAMTLGVVSTNKISSTFTRII